MKSHDLCVAEWATSDTMNTYFNVLCSNWKAANSSSILEWPIKFGSKLLLRIRGNVSPCIFTSYSALFNPLYSQSCFSLRCSITNIFVCVFCSSRFVFEYRCWFGFKVLQYLIWNSVLKIMFVLRQLYLFYTKQRMCTPISHLIKLSNHKIHTSKGWSCPTVKKLLIAT